MLFILSTPLRGSLKKELPATWKEHWGPAMELDNSARKLTKGDDLDCLNTLSETRDKTLAQFLERDGAWLMTVDETWPWGPEDSYCKWFHVAEYEANHNGQVEFLKSPITRVRNPPRSYGWVRKSYWRLVVPNKII
jgi:hypothetical protein